MKSNIQNIAARALLSSGLALGIASAYGAGNEVSRVQEPQIQAGMTAAQVRSILGAPQAIQAYGNQPGPVWNYRVSHANSSVPDAQTVFEVDFDAHGRVMAANEFVSDHDSSPGD